MKIQSLFILALFSLNFIACQKDEDPQPELKTISEEEAAEIVEGALASQSEGIATETLDAAYVADEYAEKIVGGSPCGMTYDSTVDRSLNNPYITALYSSTWEWEVFCNNLDIPTTMNYARTTAGTYATNRLESDDQANSTWTVDNLFGGNPYLINGVYERNGTQQSLIRDQNAFSSNILIEVDDLVIDKDDKHIESGIASFTLTGEVEGGESFSFEGDIIFLGDLSANLIINGTVYTIEL
ncbi:MAG: hypothetical protein KDC34_03500 [Saprospiraceae bacterium]|nr:hypothetical protein [Saprospiraceae bacterium]